jgi:hypothetical protein
VPAAPEFAPPPPDRCDPDTTPMEDPQPDDSPPAILPGEDE